MKIAFLGPSYPWRGGISQFAGSLAAKLLLHGNEVRMFTFIQQYPALLFNSGSQLEDGEPEMDIPTERVLTPYNPLTFLQTVNHIKAWAPDVLIISYWLPVMAPAFGYITTQISQIKKVYLIHNLDFHEKWLFANALSRFAMRRADGFITLSAVTQKALQGIVTSHQYQQSLQLFHPVFELSGKTGYTREEMHPTLLFFGFVKKYKGLDILLAAMPEILKELPELRLIIAGDVYGDKQPYLDMLTQLGISHRVDCHFRYISMEETGKFFSSCDVCVLPYRSATQSGVAQMAFAYEIPVIATRVGGIGEVVIDGVNGLLVEPENPLALKDSIISYFRNNRAEQFKEAIRKANAACSWDSFAGKVTAYLKDLL